MTTTRRLGRMDASSAAGFFEDCRRDAEIGRFFRPHPLTAEFAHLLCDRLESMRDRYYGVFHRGTMAAYFMLRGWDEGYAVPSFGCCTHPDLRDAKLGHAMIAHAIAESRAVGAERLRLTVFKSNARGVHLYRKCGFALSDHGPESYVGVLALASAPSLAVPEPNVIALDRWLAGPRAAAA